LPPLDSFGKPSVAELGTPRKGIADCHMGHLRGGYLAEHHSQRGPVISKGLPPNFSLQMLAKGQQPTGSIRACRENDRSSVVGNSHSRYLDLVAGQTYHSGIPQASEETRTQVKPRRFVSAVAHKRLGPGGPGSQKDAHGAFKVKVSGHAPAGDGEDGWLRPLCSSHPY
jgi:hypothetical protein